MWPTVTLTAFLALSAANLFGTWTGRRKLIVLSKPLLMPALAAYYLLACFTARPADAVPAGGVNWLIFGGVAAGFLGDVCLLVPDNHRSFLAGLAAFLGGHLLYLTAFLLSFTGRSPELWPLLVLLPLALYAAWYLHRMAPFLGEMRLPVDAYVAVIVAMSTAAFLRAGALGGPSGWLVVAGSLLFIASDSLLGAATFVPTGRAPSAEPSPGAPPQEQRAGIRRGNRYRADHDGIRLADALVMPTYLLAQALIVQGFLV